MAAYNAGEGLEAIKKFKASNSAKANYMIGVIYENGCGNIPANASMAHKYYKIAEEKGNK
jgi:TPR repeat protein